MGLREFGRDKTAADQAFEPAAGADGVKVSLKKRILYVSALPTSARRCAAR